MKKWVGFIIVVLIAILFLFYQSDKEKHFIYDSNIITIYQDDIKTLFGDIEIVNQEVKTEQFKSMNLYREITYTIWNIEYKTNQGLVKQFQLDNKSDLLSQMNLIIIEALIKDITQSIIPNNIEPIINFENLDLDIQNINDIPLNLYPINIQLNELPDDLLIVVSPRGDMVNVFKVAKDEIIFRINEKKLKNVLLLEGTEAYQMDHGVFVIDGEVIHEKISVDDALDWLESNR